MELTAYAMTQFAIGNAARFNALVGFAVANIAAWQDWTESGKKISMAESAATLKSALITARVPETSRDRFLSTVSGMTTRLNVDAKAALAEARGVYMAAETPEAARAEAAVAAVARFLREIGADSLGYLESYAKGGKAALAGAIAKAEAQAEALAKRAAMTEAEAAEAAEADKAEAEAAEADKTPRAKAAKQAAAMLAALAKHGDHMTDAELTALASAIAETVAKRRALETEARILRDKAQAARDKAETAAEERLAAAHDNGDLRAMQAAQADIDRAAA